MIDVWYVINYGPDDSCPRGASLDVLLFSFISSPLNPIYHNLVILAISSHCFALGTSFFILIVPCHSSARTTPSTDQTLRAEI